MHDVIEDMVREGKVRKTPWYSNKVRIDITEKGRKEYEETHKKSLAFQIPYHVSTFLELRKPRIEKLFPIQQMFVDRGLLHSKDNVCVFGYPGIGKTLIAEMAMADEIEKGNKVLYCTPYRALDWQKYNDFTECFGNKLKCKVVITDGDNPVSKSELLTASVIIATYERVSGAVRTNEEWLRGISLVCADEITLLDEDDRGGELDLLLTHFKQKNSPPRIITLSSLVGNPLQISEWLNAEPVIDNRPLPSMDIEENLVHKKGDELCFLRRDGKQYSKKTKEGVIEHILKQQLGKNETTIIFVGTRFETETLAKMYKRYHQCDLALAERANAFFASEMWEKTELNESLRELIGYGIAFHHAGVQKKARKFVESLMKERLLKTVIATTTLSHGVDYSIDNVIIDLPGILKTHELHGYEYINIKGRTGRFGKSSSASVYLITDNKLAKTAFNKYFSGSPEPIFPSETFSRESLASIIIGEANKSETILDELMKKLKATFRGTKVTVSKIALESAIREIVKMGFLKPGNDDFRITELGKKVNAANLSPYEAEAVFSIPSTISTTELLDIASCSCCL